MDVGTVIAELRASGDPRAVEGMMRFGISGHETLGVSVPKLQSLAKRLGKDHELAAGLWESGIHEARILAAMVDEPEKVTSAQMDRWVKQFDSWDVCDGCCGSLFDKTKFAYSKAIHWSKARPEFVKRGGFALMAELAVHDKEAPDAKFLRFLGEIKRQSTDERNFVKKAVNWALRQIGKRNATLNKKAIRVAVEIGKIDSRSSRWIAADALRELRSDAVARKLRKKP
ncbi:MAG: DNA alkylation repair protein [Nitrososphaerales archaeon]|nr:DNA alkylation repair protein [Nitrososphaerales archaeon]